MGTLYVGQERIDPGLTRGVEIIDSLDSHEEDSALSKEKGEELASNKLDHLTNGNGMTVSSGIISINLDEDTVYTDDNQVKVKVIDNLTTTADTGALSANQGRVINEAMYEEVSRFSKKTLSSSGFSALKKLRPGDYINGDISHFSDETSSISFEGVLISSDQPDSSSINCNFFVTNGTILIKDGDDAGRYPVSPTHLARLSLRDSTDPSVCSVWLEVWYLIGASWNTGMTAVNEKAFSVGYTQRQLLDNEDLASNFTLIKHSQVPGES